MASLQQLNDFLADKSFIAGFVPSRLDVETFRALGAEPGPQFPHAKRFFKQLSSFSPKQLEKLATTEPSGPVPTYPRLAAGAASSTHKVESSSSLPEPDPYSRRTFIKSVLGTDGGERCIGMTLRVGGWVKSGRDQKQFAFVELNDGSTPINLQVVVLAELGVPFSKLTPTGTSILVEGVIKPTPADVKKAKQLVELHATSIIFVGECDAGKNPISKTKLSLEFLRSVSHLRPRTNTISAVSRIRNALAFATHDFFQSKKFLYVHSPIVTASDCEGAGEMFGISTLLNDADKLSKQPKVTDAEVAEAQAAVNKQTEIVNGLKGDDKEGKKKKKGEAGEKLKEETEKLSKLKSELQHLEYRRSLVGGIPRKDNGKGDIDFSHDFFGKPAFLTVSGQLEGEVFACAMSSVYTFGPTFRAENSHTTRHLAEFWMIEPEIAFCDIWGNMQCAEDYVRHCCNFVLEHCFEDLEFMAQRIDPECINRVRKVATTPFARMTYTDAVTLLENHINEGKVKFENEVYWGVDLASEHERYICEKVHNQPTILYNYPKEIKAFYMRVNEDGKTVAAMDVLVPGVGELIGGSQREERFEVLEKRIIEAGLPVDSYHWYLDLRRFGTVVHSGFGLGFERLILFCTGMENIRDVIPFPRYPGHCDL